MQHLSGKTTTSANRSRMLIVLLYRVVHGDVRHFRGLCDEAGGPKERSCAWLFSKVDSADQRAQK